MTDINAESIESSVETPQSESNVCTEFMLHRSDGKIDTSQADFLEPVNPVTAHKSPSTMSAQNPCPADLPNLRETVSGSNIDTEVSGIAETDTAVQEALQSFVAAVHKKYKDDYNDDDAQAISESVGDVVFVPKSGPVKVTASGNIMLPRQVSMSGCEISVAGDPALIMRMCQRVKELDLMENNIFCWDEVFCIIECIPQLTFLNLTKNQLTSDLPDLTGRKLPNLSHLVLNNTMITWDVVLGLLKHFPSVEELHLSLNGFENVDIPLASSASEDRSSSPTLDTVPRPLQTYPTLRKLFFIGNKVTDWREMNKLGAYFPSLEFLLLSETDLATIEGTDDVGDCFPCLQTLGLNRTLLQSWEEIEKFRLFPSLTDIRLNAIPFLEAFPEKERRQQTIAILPNITTLNGSPVKETEREDAERAYIRLYMDKEEKPKRYYELEKLHGKLDPLVEVQLGPQSHVRIKFRVEGPNFEVIKTEEMQVRVDQTVKELKKLVSNIAGKPPSKFTLFYVDVGMGGAPERLMYMERKVLSYCMRDGDEIIVECKA